MRAHIASLASRSRTASEDGSGNSCEPWDLSAGAFPPDACCCACLAMPQQRRARSRAVLQIGQRQGRLGQREGRRAEIRGRLKRRGTVQDTRSESTEGRSGA